LEFAKQTPSLKLLKAVLSDNTQHSTLNYTHLLNNRVNKPRAIPPLVLGSLFQSMAISSHKKAAETLFPKTPLKEFS